MKTTSNFKVGDKVYVVPGRPTFAFTHYIRATITEVGQDGWGYRLRTFLKDLPGIYMFNIWDEDLLPRTDKSQKKLPPEFLPQTYSQLEKMMGGEAHEKV